MFKWALPHTLQPIKSMFQFWTILPWVNIYHCNIFLFTHPAFFRTSSFCHLKCKSHANCYDDEKCIDGECQPGCSTDAHCKTGFKCFHDECKKSCQSDQTCIAGHYGTYCHIDHKVCHGACSEDADCSGGYTCFEKRCMKHCSKSKHCNYGQYCDRFVYLCNTMFYRSSHCQFSGFLFILFLVNFLIKNCATQIFLWNHNIHL